MRLKSPHSEGCMRIAKGGWPWKASLAKTRIANRRKWAVRTKSVTKKRLRPRFELFYNLHYKPDTAQS